MLRHRYLIAMLFGCVVSCFTTAAIGDVKSSIESKSTDDPVSAPEKLPEAQKDKPRGQLLYENHCGGCHETSVHGRDPRKAASIGEIRLWINVWQKELKLNWSDADIDEVTMYINDRYYQFSE